MKLQQFLNDTPDLRVAPAGSPGSAGMETMYYGPATAAAVSKMQVMFRAEVLTPNGLVNPTGYFGASSRAKANDLCVTPGTTPTPDTDEDGMEDEDEEDDMSLSGEGTLDTFEVDDAEDEVSEGAQDEVVMAITTEATQGDIEIARMTFTLVGNSNEEEDPWDVYEEIALWVDGDKIAAFEADDEDNYLNEDDGEFRFSNLGLVLEEDEEMEILVAVTVENSVDGADNDDSEWTLRPTEVRYFDADGVAETDSSTDELGDPEVFDIVEEGEDDGADIESSSSNPDEADIEVDVENDETDEVLVHTFDIEVDSDSSDLELNDAFVWVTVSNPSGAADLTVGDVIGDIYLDIDGEKVKGEDLGDVTSDDDKDDPTEIDYVVTAGNDNRVGYRFEFDGLMLDGDEDYETDVTIVFDGQDDGANYENAVSIATDVIGSEWEVEGSADDNVLSGTDTSDTHSLFSAGITVDVVEAETDITTGDSPADDTVDFRWELDITAFGEDDVYITNDFANIVAALASTTAAEIAYTVEQTGGANVTVTGGTITSSADDVTGDDSAYGGVYDGAKFFLISSGQTETFTMTVSAENQTDSKQIQAFLEAVEWTTDEVDDATGSDLLSETIESYTTGLEDDSETGFKTIN